MPRRYDDQGNLLPPGPAPVSPSKAPAPPTVKKPTLVTPPSKPARPKPQDQYPKRRMMNRLSVRKYEQPHESLQNLADMFGIELEDMEHGS